ncbi:MAG: hypothetical protein WA364_00215 [Candidatus Nitrosopolaris sp.]
MSLINSETPANPSESNTKPAVIESDTKTGQQDDPVEVPEVFLANGEFNDEAIHWLPGHIVDQLYLQMCASREIPIRKELLIGEKYCDNQNKYYAEAATYAGRISAGDFSGKNDKCRPVFRLYLEDFSPRLKAELAELPKETVHRIVTEAVFRIFRARHRMIFYQHIENERLRWVFL